MSAIQTPRSQTSRRRWMIGAGVVAAAIALVWFLLARKKDGPTPGGKQGGTSSGMAGMSDSAMRSDKGSGAVELTASQITTFGITFDTVKLRTLSSEVRAAGAVTFDETRIAQITPRFAGYAERLFVNATGQTVSRGQAVAAIYSPELVAAQSELLLAGRLDESLGQGSVPGVRTGGPSMLSAARQRLRQWNISDAQIDAVLRSGKIIRAVTLYSPVSGVVVEKNVVQGQSVTPGMPLMTVADLSTVWVTAELRESDAGSVRQGSPASIELSAFPGQRIEGRVSYVYPTLQTEARTIKARIVLPNPGGRIKPGMYATVRMTTPMATALTAPASAVIQTGDRTYVFVEQSGRQLIPRDVRLGRRGGDYVEVLSGVRAGERVVTSAQFLLDSESNLAEVMRSMIGQGGNSGAGDMEGMDMGPATEGTATDKGADMKGMNMPSPAKR